MNEPQKTLVQQWVLRAENDLLNVANNIQAKRVPWDTVCFHCQQAAEKYIKAVLAVYAQEIPRTHDLEQLLELTKEWVPKLEEVREDLQWLTVHAIVGRYPVEVVQETPGETEGRRAQDIAQYVRERCRLFIERIDAGLLDQK